MSHFDTTGQLALFPELIDSPELPSISTLPEFDRALHNLIKMSDLGAFISITVHGLDKSFSVHARELEIPEDFLLDGRSDATSQQIHLFPKSLRHQVRRLSYDVKRFFNKENSFRTPFGYFLFRPYFRIWSKFVREQEQRLSGFLTDYPAESMGTTSWKGVRQVTGSWNRSKTKRLPGNSRTNCC